MTGRPAALRAFALASTARVADSVMAAMRAETRRAGATMAPSSYTRGQVDLDRVLWPCVRWFDRAAGQAVHSCALVVCHPARACPRPGRCAGRAPARRAVAQLVRVPVSKTGGWGFESLRPCCQGSCCSVTSVHVSVRTRREVKTSEPDQRRHRSPRAPTRPDEGLPRARAVGSHDSRCSSVR